MLCTHDVCASVCFYLWAVHLWMCREREDLTPDPDDLEVADCKNHFRRHPSNQEAESI